MTDTDDRLFGTIGGRIGPRNDLALSTLMYLSGLNYSMEVLEPIFGRQNMRESSVWQAALAEGRAQGTNQGVMEGLRMACREQVWRHHPALMARADPLIEACVSRERLKVWVVEASLLDDEAFLKMLKSTSLAPPPLTLHRY